MPVTPVMRGRQFFMNPGPTNIPDRVLNAMHRPAVDFVETEFKAVAEECFAGLKRVFKTEHPVYAYAASGHGAWEIAFANTCSPGDTVLVLESGAFSVFWTTMAEALGLKVETLAGDWRRGIDPNALEAKLREDTARDIRAVLAVHNETSTGVANRIDLLRQAIDAAGHPALFFVDTISSLASFDFRMDEWKVDVAVGGSQKGLMLPPGVCFTGVSPKAMEATQSARMPRRYWDWKPRTNDRGQPWFVGTAPVHLFFGLQEGLKMLEEEGLDNVFARHNRLAKATRAAAAVWSQNGGPELYCTNPDTFSDSVSAILVPDGSDAEKVRRIAIDKYNVSLGGGLTKLGGKVFRIGHMGDLNEPMLLGALSIVELSMTLAGVPYTKGGVEAAVASLAEG